MPAGRPPYWTPEKKAAAKEELLRRLSSGELAKDICAEDHMPSTTTAWDWEQEDPEFAESYARARERQADTFAQDVVKIADTDTDYMRARNRMDARKWMASKMHPRRYSERVIHDGDLTVRLTDDQLESRLAQLLGKTGAALAPRGAGEADEPT